MGKAVTSHLFDLDWIRHTPTPRAVTLTDAGQNGLRAIFGIPTTDETAPG